MRAGAAWASRRAAPATPSDDSDILEAPSQFHNPHRQVAWRAYAAKMTQQLARPQHCPRHTEPRCLGLIWQPVD
eukprot:9503921-Pyramimonas_sp.AAC.2